MNKLEDVFTKEDLKEIFKFSKAASNALKGVRRGLEVEFKCPICECEVCGRAFIE